MVYTGILEGRSVQVPAMTGGKILQILVESGDQVRVGDTLAVIDTTELGFQDRQLGAKLKELDAQVEIARTKEQRAQANLRWVRINYQRIKALVGKKSLAQQRLDDLSNQLHQAEYILQEARQASRSVAARRQQLLAQRSSLRKRIQDAFLLSSQEGIVLNRYFEVGEAIHRLSPLVEILDNRKLWVKIYVGERTLPHIHYGEEVKIRVDGLARELAGKVSWVSPQAEFTPKPILTPETRTSLVYAVKVTVTNPQGVLKDGMPVEVVLPSPPH